MKNKIQLPGFDMETMKILDCENLLGGKLGEGKRNRCVVLPANVPMVADSLKRKNQNWIARADSPTDLIIQLGDSTFHLHKLAMVSRSEYLNRLVFQKKNNRETTGDILNIQIDNLPGGRKTFELVVKFCYGWKFDMTAANIASLYCASNFLEMSEDIEVENLISNTCNFLLQLLKAGLMLKINPELLCVLERRVVLMLDKCCVQDLLVKNQEEKESLYDVAVVVKVLQSYVRNMPSNNHAEKLNIVGRLVDGYLTQIARDQKLTVESFKSVVEALPQNARYCDDTLYRAIDTYLKAHAYLTEEDREDVCRVMEYHRLSREARQHVMQNDRLPLKLSERFVLLEQVNMSWRVMSDGSNYRRRNTQTSIRISRDLEKKEMNQEINVMRKDVEMMKSQLLELNTCKIKLQKHLKRCIR